MHATLPEPLRERAEVDVGRAARGGGWQRLDARVSRGQGAHRRRKQAVREHHRRVDHERTDERHLGRTPFDGEREMKFAEDLAQRALDIDLAIPGAPQRLAHARDAGLGEVVMRVGEEIVRDVLVPQMNDVVAGGAQRAFVSPRVAHDALAGSAANR